MQYVISQFDTKLDVIKNAKIYIKTPNLPEKLNLENMTKTEKDPDGRIDYLQNLKGSESALAEEYIRNTPKQIATKYRNQIIKTLGWE